MFLGIRKLLKIISETVEENLDTKSFNVLSWKVPVAVMHLWKDYTEIVCTLWKSGFQIVNECMENTPFK